MSAPTFENVYIRGMHFQGEAAKQYPEAMQPGDTLALEREPENPYDENAIKAITPDGLHLGYVGKEYAAWISGWIDDGVEFIATCTDVVFEKNNYYPVVTISPVED